MKKGQPYQCLLFVLVAIFVFFGPGNAAVSGSAPSVIDHHSDSLEQERPHLGRSRFPEEIYSDREDRSTPGSATENDERVDKMPDTAGGAKHTPVVSAPAERAGAKQDTTVNARTIRLTRPQRAVPDTLEIQALRDLYESTNGDQWAIQVDDDPSNDWPRGVQWDAITSLAQLTKAFGIVLKNGDVSALTLQLSEYAGINMSGPMPGSLGDLRSLEILKVGNNRLTGELPRGLGRLQRLRILSIPYNQLTGSIPGSIFALPALEVLALNGNQLAGPLPSTVDPLHYDLPNPQTGVTAMPGISEAGDDALADMLNFKKVEGLISNTGTGSRAIENITESSTEVTRSPSNGQADGGSTPGKALDLSGVQSKDLDQFAALRVLNLSENALSGAIPSWIGKFPNLTDLRISDNTFSGTLPNALGALSGLQTMALHNTDLHGAIPDYVLGFSQLVVLQAYEANFDAVPDFTQHPNKQNLQLGLWYNQLDFEDLEKLYTSAGAHPFRILACIPQKTGPMIHAVQVREYRTLRLNVSSGGVHDRWQWQRFEGDRWVNVPGALDRILQVENVSHADSGLYRYIITNEWVTGLTLQSEPIRVVVIDVKENYAVASGNWSDPGVWGGDPGMPDRNRRVQIDGHSITITNDQQCGDILLTNQQPGTSLTISQGRLEVHGRVIVANVSEEARKCRLEVKGTGKITVMKATE
jgi:hypothetical protein